MVRWKALGLYGIVAAPSIKRQSSSCMSTSTINHSLHMTSQVEVGRSADHGGLKPPSFSRIRRSGHWESKNYFTSPVSWAWAQSCLNHIISSGETAPSGPGPRCRGFTITLRHTTHSVELLWTSDQPEAETSIWQHTTLTRDGHPCPPVGFEPTIPASGRPKTHALDHAATGIGKPYNSLSRCEWY